MMEQKVAQLQAKFEADASLGEKLFSLETPAEVQSLLKEQGVDFTLDEIAVLREAIVKAVEESENGELPDKAMEVVVGGSGEISSLGAVLGYVPHIRPYGPRW